MTLHLLLDDRSFRDEEETLPGKIYPEENGRVYLYEKAYLGIGAASPWGGGQLCHGAPGAQWGGVRRGALAAWEARGEALPHHQREVYLPGASPAFTAVSTWPRRPAVRPWTDRGCGHRPVSPAPSTGAATVRTIRCRWRTVESHCGRLPMHGLLCRPPPVGWGGPTPPSSPMAGPRWYQVGALAGRTLNVTLPEAGTFCRIRPAWAGRGRVPGRLEYPRPASGGAAGIVFPANRARGFSP